MYLQEKYKKFSVNSQTLKNYIIYIYIFKRKLQGLIFNLTQTQNLHWYHNTNKHKINTNNFLLFSFKIIRMQ